MVVGVDAGVGQALGLSFGQQAQARAHLQARVRVPHRHDGLGDVLHVRVGRSSPARHQAHACRAGMHRTGRGVVHHVGPHGSVREDARLGTPPLRAVVAVLRAEARLEVDQEVHLHGVGEGGPPQHAGRGHRGDGVGVGEPQDRQRVGSIEGVAPLRRRPAALEQRRGAGSAGGPGRAGGLGRAGRLGVAGRDRHGGMVARPRPPGGIARAHVTPFDPAAGRATAMVDRP